MEKQIKIDEIYRVFEDFCAKTGEICTGCKYKTMNGSCFENFVKDNYVVERHNNEQTTI